MEVPPNSGNYVLMDVHGAGAQRGDPKSGDPANWPHGNGPQGDQVRIYNFARCVRGGIGQSLAADAYTLPAATGATIGFSLDGGPSNANRDYLLCGSLSGTMPGTLLPGGGATIPLNRDWYTEWILSRLNGPVYAGFWGTLDASGQATAQMIAPPISSVWERTTIYYSFATMNPWDFVSNAVAVEVE